MTLKEPPPVGSVRESVLLMLLIQKDRTEHAATRMMVQSQINPGEGPKAFDEYIKIRYPYLETAKDREKIDTIQRLKDEIARGPIMVTPMRDGLAISKLRRKADKAAETVGEDAIFKRLTRKIGKSIPT